MTLQDWTILETERLCDIDHSRHQNFIVETCLEEKPTDKIVAAWSLLDDAMVTLATAEMPWAPLKHETLWSCSGNWVPSWVNISICWRRVLGNWNNTKFPRWSPHTSNCQKEAQVRIIKHKWKGLKQLPSYWCKMVQLSYYPPPSLRRWPHWITLQDWYQTTSTKYVRTNGTFLKP